MPAAIPFLIGAAVSALLPSAITGAVIFAGIKAGALITTGIGLVVGSSMARRQEKKATAAARAQHLASLRDVQAIVRSATAPTQVLYGRVMVGGVIPFWFTDGDVGQFHHWGQVLAGHEIDGVDSWWVNDEQVSVDANGFVTTEKFTKAGNPLIRVRLYNGTQTTLDADILAASAGAMSIGDCARGKAWVAVMFEADHDVFGQIGAPTIRCVVRGKRLFDPRTGLTAFTDNAALAVRDFLLADYGLRCTTAEVNNADIIAAANICAEAVGLGSGITQPRYTVNGALSAATGLQDNLEMLVDAMAGMAVWSQGQWRVKAGAHETPARTLTASDIQQVEELVAYTPRRDLFNTVTGTFVDPASLYAERQYPLVTNTFYVAQDGNQTIERQINQPLVNDAARAQRLAKIEIERTRQAVTVSLLCKWTAYDLTPGDHVAITLTRYGWSGKVFFVASRELSDAGVRYVLRETAAAVWAWNFGEATRIDPAPNTNLPNPFKVADVIGLSAFSGTNELQITGDGAIISRILVTWHQIADYGVRVGGRIEIGYRPLGSVDWMTARVDGSESRLHIGPVEDGIVYELQARAINSTGQRGRVSTISHTVIGKTAPPPDVTGFVVSGSELVWLPVNVPDLAGYLIRFQHGNNVWWDNATPLHAGIITEAPWTLVTRPVGTVTIMIKAIDKSRNESLNPAFIIINLGGSLVANVLEQWPQAPTWPGLHNGTILGGHLLAVGTDFFYGPDLQPFYGLDADPFYAAGTFNNLQYDFTITPTVASNALLVLQHDISAPSFSIEYMRSIGAIMTWLPWPGSIRMGSEGGSITWRVRLSGGVTQPTIRMLTPQLDVPDVIQRSASIAIATPSTRIPLTQAFRAIQNVQLTLQGTTARTALVLDKNATLGPLVQLLGADGNPTTGLVDAVIQGF